MVYYCCVRGCGNNSKNKKNSSSPSFHVFPSNPDLKKKWLKAIGRPNWEPSVHARICSTHFDDNQVTQVTCRARIKDDALPCKELPPNSNFEASDIEVCRFCLTTDVKMFSLEHGLFKDCMTTIAVLNENYNIEGLPRYVCYQCAAHLIKFYSFIEKSMAAQATLLDVFARNGQITKTLIRNSGRDNWNLNSILNFHRTTPTYVFEFNYDHDQNISKLTNYEFVSDSEKNTEIQATEVNVKKENYLQDNVESKTDLYNKVKERIIDECDVPNDATLQHDYNDKTDDNDSDFDSIDNEPLNKLVTKELDDIKSVDSHALETVDQKVTKSKFMTNENSLKRKPADGLTPDEMKMLEYFDIVKLTLQEQKVEWLKTMGNRPWVSKTRNVYKCEICTKIFAHVNTYTSHIALHDPSRGKASCPVCKLRFKNEASANSHATRMHGRKYHCKSCPKVFNSVVMAKRHRRWHNGHVYSCSQCAFTSAHESAWRVHTARLHGARVACARCGRACVSRRALSLHTARAHPAQRVCDENLSYRCEECDLGFNTEGARRVHIITSQQHRKQPRLQFITPDDPILTNSCRTCGTSFPTRQDLREHNKAEHRKTAKKKSSWRLPGDSYPTPCEHCGDILNSRQEHYWHVRRVHPADARSYRPVVTAVCHTCGKGYQNSTKLKLHELRHSSPRVRCSQCARMFYDKYALARHAASHLASRPHACAHCPRAFKHKGNLDRHARVHTGVTPYDCTICGKKFKYSTSLNLHVRTVHYKLPHPPRKRRTTKTDKNTDAISNIC